MVAKPGEAKPYFQIAKERKAALQGKVTLTGADKLKADGRYTVVCRAFENGKSDREISRDIGIRPQTVADMRKAWEQDKLAGALLDGLELETVQ
jgi:transposase-like protein